LADELLNTLGRRLTGVTLRIGQRGDFEIVSDGELIFSKQQLDRFPNAGEIVHLLRTRG
jgi:selT/selW/selH-like putative selenoprotein